MNVIWFRSGHCISTRITTESDMVSSLVSVYIIQESLISSESGQSYILPKNHYRLQRNSVYHQYLATPFTHHLDSMSGNLPALPIVKCEVKASLHKLEFHVAPPEMHVERTYLPATLHLTLHSDPSGYSSKFTLAFFLLSVVYKSDQLLIKKTPPGEGGHPYKRCTYVRTTRVSFWVELPYKRCTYIRTAKVSFFQMMFFPQNWSHQGYCLSNIGP